jgi:glucosamine-phosphate N-acetyltransferase
MDFRRIETSDYYKDYLLLLEQLTIVEKEKINYEQFKNFVESLSNNHIIIIVIEDNNKTIGAGTLLIENKIIHNMGSVGHIEGLIIHNNYRKLGLGKKIIDELVNISIKANCYKTILDCSEKNSNFYEKLGFSKKEIQMVKYL